MIWVVIVLLAIILALVLVMISQLSAVKWSTERMMKDSAEKVLDSFHQCATNIMDWQLKLFTEEICGKIPKSARKATNTKPRDAEYRKKIGEGVKRAKERKKAAHANEQPVVNAYTVPLADRGEEIIQ